MTPEQCAREYIRYTAVINSLDKGNLRFVMCGPNGHDVEWTRRLMAEWSARKWQEAPTFGVSVHYYCGNAGDPLAFTEDEWYLQLFKADRMRRVIDDHRAAMDGLDPERKLALVVDEWGCWHPDGSGPSKGYNLFEQQSTMRDAMVAATTLNAFNNRADIVAMANVAQLCNNLHSLYLAAGEHFVETPNYYVFDLFKTHMGGRQLNSFNDLGAYEREGFAPMDRLSSSASVKDDGAFTLTLANRSVTESARVKLRALGGSLDGVARVRTLCDADPHAHNDFKHPDRVRPSEAIMELANGVEIDVPAGGIVAIIREVIP
ncbi:MAG: hypothetical protein GX558_08575 [Clostridiales bacterium]|nr:hypothetical protein [Clostridiales bacterium]